MFRLPSSWVWDFWFADDGDTYHLFFLKASRALVDPNGRHRRAIIGHAVSTDLATWTEVADALVPSDGPAFDDLATWTGSVCRDDAGLWQMFYTGISRGDGGMIQRIGSACSNDLLVWERNSAPIGMGPDYEWYEAYADGHWADEAWRDPWVFRDPTGDGWMMLTTARANTGDPRQRGVVGAATSQDLANWTVEKPLSQPGSGFGQLEVLQLAEVDGRHVLVFSCGSAELAGAKAGQRGGVWAVNADSASGPFQIDDAYRIADEMLYVGRLIQRREHSWALLAFHNIADDGTFVGEITDPMTVEWIGDRLTVLAT